MTARLPVRPLWGLALGVACLTAGLPARADEGQLDTAVLKKVKAATVHLEVTLPDGSTVEGSGFFTDEPGVVLTNAHVLGMLDADSRPPVKVAVTLNSGEADSRTLAAKLLGVDRGSDLALLRVEGKDLPAALKVVSAKDLTRDGGRCSSSASRWASASARTSPSASRRCPACARRTAGSSRSRSTAACTPATRAARSSTARARSSACRCRSSRGTAMHFAIPGETVHGVPQRQVHRDRRRPRLQGRRHDQDGLPPGRGRSAGASQERQGRDVVRRAGQPAAARRDGRSRSRCPATASGRSSRSSTTSSR